MRRQRSSRLSKTLTKGEVRTRAPLPSHLPPQQQPPRWYRVARVVFYGFFRLLWWPVWAVLAIAAWLANMITGGYWGLLILLCPSAKLRDYLTDHNQFLFGK